MTDAEQEEQGQQERRLRVETILATATEDAQEELDRTSAALGFSGLSAGLTMGITALGVALVQHALGPGEGARLVATTLYPLGFVAVIIGRMQLFTENTLYPVVLLFTSRRHLADTARLWVVVLLANLVGALGFALLAVRTHALGPGQTQALVELGTHAVQGSRGHVFWSGVVGGWLIALVAWLVTASRLTLAQVLVIWLFTYVVGLGEFAHCIASSDEILSAVVHGDVATSSYLGWLWPATLGNAIGGVVLVSVLNFAQVHAPGRDG